MLLGWRFVALCGVVWFEVWLYEVVLQCSSLWGLCVAYYFSDNVLT